LKFSHTDLLGFAGRLLFSAGVPGDDARLVARMLVQSDLSGYPAHGIAHISSYLSRIQTGLIRLDQRPQVMREGKTTALVDGRFYIGQIAAYEATKLAIAKASEHGVGVVSLFHSGHVGRLADYVEMAAEEGMIGVAAVSVGGNSIASYGSMAPVGGTNPMAFGIPGRDGRHIVLDFATAAMSMGELRHRVGRGEAIPEGVMLDGQGYPTTDFKAFSGPPKGVVLPFGGYKGSGLHLVAEILGGLLTGNGLGREWWNRGGPAINGLFFQAIQIEEFRPMDEFLAKLDELVEFTRSRQPAPGFGPIRLPGERSRANAERQMKDGVEMEETAWAELVRCAAELGIQDIPQSLGEGR